MRKRLIAILLVATSACQQQQPKTPLQAAQLSYDGADYTTQAAKIAHGKRLADILDCTGCHGSNLQGKDMADKPEDGAMYSPNVTLAAARYSNAELERLIRHGEPRDRREFWFMQVESYQFLSDRDVAAIIGFVRSFKPAGKPLPPFKLNRAEQKDVDSGVMKDAAAQIAKYRRNPPLGMGPQFEWGRYIVKTTCTACHNNALQGWPNWTPNLDIAGAYSKVELTQLLTNGKGKAGKDVGLMSGIARAHFSHLTPREREAVVDYVLARANRPQAAN